MQIDRRLVSSFDWPLFVLSIGLALLGIMTIYSATCSVDEECSRYLATKQSYWLVIGMVMMVATFSVDYQRLNRWAYPIYAAVVILLALVLVTGITSGGSQRWLDLKFFAFQPSELAKLVLVLVLAKTLCYYEPGYSLTALGVPLMLCAPVLALVLLQPDLGTAVLIFLIAMVVVVMSGLRMRSLLYFAVAAIATLPVGWQFLKPYQKTRLWTFMNPESDPLGAGYHVVQSKIAIGSGQLWGKGYLQGSPEPAGISPGTTYGFHLLRICRRVGVLGLCAAAGGVCVDDPARASGRATGSRSFRRVVGHGNDRHPVLAVHHQHRHGHRPAARGGNSVAADQLRADPPWLRPWWPWAC